MAAGCASIQSPPRPTLGATPVRETWAGEASSGVVLDNWLESFGDPTLTRLVNEALKNNPDLAATAARLDQAIASANAAGAALYPGLDAGIQGQNSTTLRRRSGTDRNSSRFGASLDLGWELDVWGRLRHSRQNAAEGAVASEFDYLAAQRSLAAQVAKAWYAAAEANLQRALSAQFVSTYEETLRLVQVRLKSGAVTEQDEANAMADLASARQRAEAAGTAFREAVRSLEVLLGRYPGAELDVTADLAAVTNPVPAGLPSELLERRADVLAMERRVAAAFHSTREAAAARLPRISLTSSLGTSSSELKDLLDPKNAALNFAANLFAPLFDAGLRQSQLESAEARQREAAESYRSTAIRAFQEVESALDSEASLAREEKELEVAVAQYERTRRLAETRYREGAISLTDLLAVQRQELQAKSSLLSMRQQRLAQRINLHLALGGDFGDSTARIAKQ